MRALLLALLFALLPRLALAQAGGYSSIIVDAHSEDILHARQIDAARYPASLTKIMTLYLVFDAVEEGRITLDTDVPVSRTAAATPPVKLGLTAGSRVTVDTLVQAVAVRSANDAAVVLAEALAGSETAFAARMTDTARELGMRGTTFRNATGLPDAEQVTTARDMAKLAHAVLTRFPQHYHYFGQASFRGRKNTNALLRRPDVDGFKTGYTRASGYNLVISGTREMGGTERRILAVVLGGASKTSRNTHMDDLVDRGFAVMAQQKPSDGRTTRREPVPAPKPPVMASAESGGRWAVQVGGFASPAEAEIAAAALQRAVRGGRVAPASGFAQGRPVFSARLENLPAAAARSLCAEHSAILAIPPRPCRVLSAGRAAD